MTRPKTLTFKFERSIPAPPEEVFDGWLDPKVSGTIWNAAEKFLQDARRDGLFYWLLRGTAHYGRFAKVERPGRLEHTWVSPNTLGQESNVTVTFKKQGDGTLMTLVHAGLPDCEEAKGHERGWNYFLGVYTEQFGKGSHKKYRFEEAHPARKGKGRG
jgi:uncharacterized protein YndB with AHSA1/START domain